MELLTMRSPCVLVPANVCWQQSGTSKSQGTRVVDRTQNTSLENAQWNCSFGVAAFGNSIGGKGGGNNTRAKFGSSSGHSRGGDDWEISSSAGGSVLNDGKGARPTHQRTIRRPGWLQARSVPRCHALENHADDS